MLFKMREKKIEKEREKRRNRKVHQKFSANKAFQTVVLNYSGALVCAALNDNENYNLHCNKVYMCSHITFLEWLQTGEKHL